MKSRALAFSCIALMLTAGCRSPTRVHEVRYPAATMLWTEDAYEASFQAPDTVRAGRPFRVTFRTFGAGCDRKGETEITYSETRRGVALRPFDYTRVDGSCPAMIQRFEHKITVVFDRPGEAVIHGYGRLRRGTAPVEELEGITQHPVIVR